MRLTYTDMLHQKSALFSMTNRKKTKELRVQILGETLKYFVPEILAQNILTFPSLKKLVL